MTNQDEEFVIETKPQTKKSNKLSALFSLKNMPIILSLSAIFFMLLGAFIAICGGVNGCLAMAGIATIINLGVLGTLTANFITEKKVSFDTSYIFVVLSILANIIAFI